MAYDFPITGALRLLRCEVNGRETATLEEACCKEWAFAWMVGVVDGAEDDPAGIDYFPGGGRKWGEQGIPIAACPFCRKPIQVMEEMPDLPGGWDSPHLQPVA